ncbi:MAG: hypothetical protein ACXWC9_07085 [Pseudobdellovibrionaceae bacterium]
MAKIHGLFFILIVASGTAFAANPFDQFLGSYIVESQSCFENGEPTTRGCDKIEIEITNDGIYPMIVEVKENASSSYPIYETDSRDEFGFEKATVSGSENLAVWTREKSFLPWGNEEPEYISQERSLKRQENIVTYVFTHYERAPGLPDGTMTRVYKLRAVER